MCFNLAVLNQGAVRAARLVSENQGLLAIPSKLVLRF
jgi:hypothetical protein